MLIAKFAIIRGNRTKLLDPHTFLATVDELYIKITTIPEKWNSPILDIHILHVSDTQVIKFKS